ncbi:bifunctional diaminohydroxyphosphoribosylaminopyrimidine deaminase/5-amino-6-(5-phosphoribosylamino)uracil reductase RibD [Naumannella huperziae]
MTGASFAPESDEWGMRRAITRADRVRHLTSPNPWVGAILRTRDGREFAGATEPPPGRHAEQVVLDAARAGGADVTGATVWVTLEPCDHHGRTAPCTEALIGAGVARVVFAVGDPDPRVDGRGAARLRAAGIAVTEGVCTDRATDQLRPYLTHRRTGRPFVIMKLAASLDGRIAAADGSSRWVTGDAARAEAHRLRAQCDAVLVGAGTVRTDDPELTVRAVAGRDPLRVVLGRAPAGARVHPCLELSGPLPDVLDDLGRRGVLQLLVEGGSRVAHDFHRAGLVDRYLMHLAPALFGGDDAAPLFRGSGARSIDEVWRGRIAGVRHLGGDLVVELEKGVA